MARQRLLLGLLVLSVALAIAWALGPGRRARIPRAAPGNEAPAPRLLPAAPEHAGEPVPRPSADRPEDPAPLESVPAPARSIRGKVVSAGARTPIAGARVLLGLDFPEEGDGAWAAEVLTARDGTFEAVGMLQAPHRLRVSAAGRLDEVLEGILPRAPPIEIALALGEGIPCALLVDTEDGEEPLPLREVHLEAHESGWSTSATSDSRGWFRITGLSREDLEDTVSNLEIRIVVPGFIEPDLRKSREGESLELKVEPGLAAHGVVLDTAGAPIPGASVAADSGHRVTSDASGRYRIEGISDSLTAFAPGRALQTVSLDDVREDEGEAEIVRVDFRLRAGVTIRGRVLDMLGRGIAGLTVSVSPDDADLDVEDEGIEREVLLALTSVTEGDGSYRVEGISADAFSLPGTMDLILRLPGAGAGLRAEVPIDAGEGEVEHSIVLDVVSGPSGVVIDSRGEPIAGAVVVARAAAGGHSSMGGTDAEGRFEIGSILAGDYELSVHVEGRPIVREKVTVPCGPLRFRLGTAGGTVGR